jgi:dephospho-CoA kinase
VIVIGLTGSIGMGKSTTALMFAEQGCALYSADLAVHSLYTGKAVPHIEAAFPGTTTAGAVDRAALGRAVLHEPAAIARLEAIVHPLVHAEEQAFLARSGRARAPAAVLDIPLLLETGGELRCDLVAVVSAAPELQRARVLARPGMTEQKLAAILARQMPDAEKRRRAHVVIDTGRDLASVRRAVGDLLRAFAGAAGRARR